MATRRAIKSVVHNFVETYTSRNSDYGGYWLFGQVVDNLDRLRFDLLAAEGAVAQNPLDFAVSLALGKFAEQLSLARLPISRIREAHLTILKLPGDVEGQVSGHKCSGHMVRFEVDVVSGLGNAYHYEKALFVARHDPTVEFRRQI